MEKKKGRPPGAPRYVTCQACGTAASQRPSRSVSSAHPSPRTRTERNVLRGAVNSPRRIKRRQHFCSRQVPPPFLPRPIIPIIDRHRSSARGRALTCSLSVLCYFVGASTEGLTSNFKTVFYAPSPCPK